MIEDGDRYKIAIVGGVELYNMLHEVFLFTNMVDLLYINPCYEDLCQNKPLLISCDLVVFDSFCEIYCPECFLHCEVQRCNEIIQKEISKKESIYYVDDLMIMLKIGLFDLLFGDESCLKKLLIFSPVFNSEASLSLDINDFYKSGPKNTDEKMHRLNISQRNYISNLVFNKNLIIPDRYVKKNCSYGSVALSTILEFQREESSYLENTRTKYHRIKCQKLFGNTDNFLLKCNDDEVNSYRIVTKKVFDPPKKNLFYVLHDSLTFIQNDFKHIYDHIVNYLHVFTCELSDLDKYYTILSHIDPLIYLLRKNDYVWSGRENLAEKSRGSYSEDENWEFNKLISEYNRLQTKAGRDIIQLNSPVHSSFKKDIILASKDKYSNYVIYGESGSGKESSAELIHYATFGFDNKKIVKENCAMLDPSLAASRIFGHRKGAFTGAYKDFSGLISRAQNGTLFLDEIHLLPDEVLGKLLRYIETGEFLRVGQNTPEKVNAKIVIATNNMEFLKKKEIVKSGFLQRFRKILYLPPVRYWGMKSLSFLVEKSIQSVVGSYCKNNSVLIEFCNVKNYYSLSCDIINSSPRELNAEIDSTVKDKLSGQLPKLPAFPTSKTKNSEAAFKKHAEVKKQIWKLCSRPKSAIFYYVLRKRLLKHCTHKEWRDTNVRGIKNFIHEFVLNFIYYHPDIVYEKNVEPIKGKRGRSRTIDFFELYNIMTNPSSSLENGRELQKHIVSRYGCYPRKQNLRNYLLDYYESHTDKVTELRNLLNANGKFEDYPDYKI